jgi:hypothetical protein
MDRFSNNSGMSINVLTATNAGNITRIAVSMRRPANTLLKNVDNNIGGTTFYAVRSKETHGTIGRQSLGNEAVNTHT